MKIDIVDKVHYIDLQKKRELKEKVALILKNLSLPKKTEICISFVDDDTMRSLNETYRGIKRTTDVLSFPQYEENLTNPSKTNFILGDILISINTAIKNSKRYQNSLEQEVQKLLIHGILHLLGYDHKKIKEAQKMREKEKELMNLIQPYQQVE